MMAMAAMAAMAQAAGVNYPPDNKKVKLTSTNLPIVWITVDGTPIDRHEHITARMKIIHNGDGQLNYADTVAYPDQHIDYEGYVALRYRGVSSFSLSDKKAYSFRPLDKPLEEGGSKTKVNILGMGKDNNWALLAPYNDKSMLRDLLAFEVSKPWMEYTPQGRYCEMFLDGIYYGVFILSEVVSKGKHRLNLHDPGEYEDEITGGYIMEVDRNESDCYTSRYHPVDSRGVPYIDQDIHIQYKSPDYEDMTQEQVDYINNRIDEMETVLWRYTAGGEETYREYIDVENFIDYEIAQELSHNVDGYRLSGKFFKRRDSEDPRFKMVVWDMNIAYGNARYYQGSRTDTWMYNNNLILNSENDPQMIPFWWYKLNSNPDYTAALKARWAQYRRSNLRLERVMATIDSLATVVTVNGAEQRNSKAWPRWGQYVWPNAFIASNYQEEVAHVKEWLAQRIAWLDTQWKFDATAAVRGDVNGDGIVGMDDLSALINHLLTGNDDGLDQAGADADEDGSIDMDDLSALINYLLSGTW